MATSLLTAFYLRVTELLRRDAWLIKANINYDAWILQKGERHMVREFLCTSVRRDLPPEIDIIRELLLSFCENLKISLRPCTKEERDEVFSFVFKTHECYAHA